ncbi:hypothetical protein C7S18_17610 [Ahniella affigens]|uniref:Uncharacterized protein n=1 Tax=Ahniella affigens TaxID=2021234 RepID=A0A2P1PVN0_9GAMM|nr:hypothetical protein [Ahniella affigens]AVP98882.1 hypothetical protein C7S18_17610 [Ahniella affigens]
MRRSALALVAVLACGIGLDARAARQDAPPPACVERLDELPLLAPTPPGKRKPKPLPFARHASCFRHGDGSEEPVVLFALDQAAPFEIQASIDNRQGKILAARVEALDAQFERIAAYPFDAFTRRGGMYSLSLFSNDPERPVRYVLVTIDPDAVGRFDQRLMSGVATFPLPGGAYNHAYESALRSEMSDTGWIAIAVTPLTETP